MIRLNERQKEVLITELKNEQQVLKNLKAVYRKAINDCGERIKILMADEESQSKIYQIKYQRQLEQQLSEILDTMNSKNYTSVSEYLTDCYTNGFVGNMYDMHGQGVPLILPINQEQIVNAVQLNSKISESLYKRMGKNTALLKKQIKAQISRGISNGSGYSEISRNLNAKADIGYNKAARIARTEGHRIQSESRLDSMNAAKVKGADVVKQWDSTLDGSTRDTHRMLDGQIREVEDDFSANGKSASAPGKFGDPAEDCNCRCAVLQRARWALDEGELKTLQGRAEYFGLDKTKDFEDFREKYLQAVDKTAESGIIKEGSDEMGLSLKIDKFTPCLIEKSTGNIVNTKYSIATDDELKLLKNKGWNFDWTADDLKDTIVYKLTLENDDSIQGLVALKDMPNDYAVYLKLAESAPQNIGNNRNYEGVGGHLFAIAAQTSVDNGYGGFIYFEAKNIELVQHYQETFRGKLIGGVHQYRMIIDEDAAKELLSKYTLKGE